MMGKFITLEGIEGAGKSTAIETITRRLQEKHIAHIVTREPGGTSIGEKVRALLLDTQHCEMSPDTELLLMFAARAQHLAEIILPALRDMRWVVCDRFTDATYAYQGGGRNQPVSHISALENLVQGDLRPDLVLLLDIAPDKGMARVDKRGTRDRFEAEKLRFFSAVREAYLQRARQDPDRYVIIDAAQSLADVATQICAAIDRL